MNAERAEDQKLLQTIADETWVKIDLRSRRQLTAVSRLAGAALFMVNHTL